MTSTRLRWGAAELGFGPSFEVCWHNGQMVKGELVDRTMMSSTHHREDMWENFVGRYATVGLKQFASWLADLRVVNIVSKPGDILVARAAHFTEQRSLVGMVHVVVITKRSIDEHNWELYR